MADRTMDWLPEHIARCNNARLPGARRRFCLAGEPVGWVQPGLAAALATFAGVAVSGEAVTLADPTRLPVILAALAEAGAFRWRGEAFDIRARHDGPVIGQMDRGALPKFGVMSVGVHVNGRVRRLGGLHLWVGRRAASKHLDPGKLDHVVAGGIPAGLTAEQTLVKEASEEAGIPAEIARQARRVGRIAYAMEREEGLRRDLLLCYDLDLPPDFTPRPVDGEVETFELWPVERVLATARAGDAFKFNVNLVLIDLFLREGLIAGDEAARLRATLDAPAPGAPG